MTMPALATLKIWVWGKSVAQDRCHELEREVAVDDGGDSGQDFEDRLDEAAQAGWREFAEEDGGEQADRNGHDDGDEGHHDGAVDEGQDAEALGGEEGGPAGAGEEVDDGDFAEELDGLAEEGDDDAGGGEDGNEGAEEEHGVDAALDELAAEGIAAGSGESQDLQVRKQPCQPQVGRAEAIWRYPWRLPVETPLSDPGMVARKTLTPGSSPGGSPLPRGDLCETLGVSARKTLTPTLSQRSPLRNPARKTPHRFRPKTAEPASQERVKSRHGFGGLQREREKEPPRLREPGESLHGERGKERRLPDELGAHR